MTPDLLRDMGITPEDRMLENVNKMFSLLRPNLPARATWEDLSGNDAQVYTEKDRRLEEPEGYEGCIACGEEHWREDMYSTHFDTDRYVCAGCRDDYFNGRYVPGR